MKHYFKLENSIITDAIQYPVDGYTEVDLPDEALPAGINGGWYRWDGSNYVLDAGLKSEADEQLKTQIIEQHTELFIQERALAKEKLLVELLDAGAITAAVYNTMSATERRQ